MDPDTLLLFEPDDIAGDLPPPGFYAATIVRAAFRDSAQGNRMIHVLFALELAGDDAHRPDYPVPDYFVLDGATPRGVATARRRLVQLYRACGIQPRQGDPIHPDDLLDARLQVRVEHDQWQGQPRLRVVAYRSTDNVSF
jgi:hypothetical protein